MTTFHASDTNMILLENKKYPKDGRSYSFNKYEIKKQFMPSNGLEKSKDISDGIKTLTV